MTSIKCIIIITILFISVFYLCIETDKLQAVQYSPASNFGTILTKTVTVGTFRY